MKNILFFLLGVIILIGCSEDNMNEPKLDSSLSEVSSTLAKMGFDYTEVKEFEEFLIIEGDIVLFKEELEKNNSLKKTTQYAGDETVVSYSKVSDIKIKVNSAFSSSTWSSVINEAINKWNSISNSKVNLSLVTSGEDILIRPKSEFPVSFPSGYFGFGTWPTEGNPGKYIWIDEDTQTSLVFDNLVTGVIHEIGHCLGFHHTNGDQESGQDPLGVNSTRRYVNLTLFDDPYSIMNYDAVIPSKFIREFSEADKRAVRALYGINFQASGSLGRRWDYHWEEYIETLEISRAGDAPFQSTGDLEIYRNGEWIEPNVYEWVKINSVKFESVEGYSGEPLRLKVYNFGRDYLTYAYLDL